MDDPLQLLPYAVPVVVAILTVPSVWQFARNIRRGKDSDLGELYEDKDGVASKESTSSFSARKQLIIISLAVGLGSAASFAFAVFATVSPSSAFDDVIQPWLLFGSWVFAEILCHES